MAKAKAARRKTGRRNGFKVSRKLYDSLMGCSATLVKAYADGLRNGGSVEWSTVDRAHEHALRAQRQLLRLRARRV